MSIIDSLVLFGSLLLIVVYGIYKTRNTKDMESYLKGDKEISWTVIGLSVMATQASAITFLSTPGLGYISGLKYVQNYFGLPIALIIISAFFIPIYQKLRVYTAYEYLEKRFDLKTRLLGAILFLLVRGLSAGITIYAPSIIISKILGWDLNQVIILMGLLVILYTVSGGTKGVSVSQKYQMVIIFAGMIIAFFYSLKSIPNDINFGTSLAIAGKLGKLNAVDLKFNFTERYNIWNGILAGIFLSLSYFGTDQSQVQRYLEGGDVTKSRLGLLFNAIFKIPMQFFILLTGVMVFVFYQFVLPPVNFRIVENNPETIKIEESFNQNHEKKKEALIDWATAYQENLELPSFRPIIDRQKTQENLINDYNDSITIADEEKDIVDRDYIFISYVMAELPVGVIGLLMAMIFAAAMSSSASELNALGTTTMIDIYIRLYPDAKTLTDRKKLLYSKLFIGFWGILTIGFALSASFLDNLIEAVNIVGSLFYGSILGIFLTGFLLKRVKSRHIFFAGIIVQIVVFIVFYFYTYKVEEIAYLWYNMSAIPVIVLSYIFSLMKINKTK